MTILVWILLGVIGLVIAGAYRTQFDLIKMTRERDRYKYLAYRWGDGLVVRNVITQEVFDVAFYEICPTCRKSKTEGR